MFPDDKVIVDLVFCFGDVFMSQTYRKQGVFFFFDLTPHVLSQVSDRT